VLIEELSFELFALFITVFFFSNLTPLNDDESLRSEMLCMLGVPTVVACKELLDFISPFK